MNATVRVQNPFVGLRPFESRDSLYYFGRKQQTRALLKQLYANRFVAVVGSSGSGKSSLVRAGLIPNLEAGFLVQDRDLWRIAIFKPGGSPLRNLAAAMASATGAPETPEAVNHLLGLMGRQGFLAIANQARLALDGNESNLLIVVDQFEELFRFRQIRTTHVLEEAADFVSILLNLAGQRVAPIYVVLTMRSDFLGECDAFQGLPEAMNSSQYLVPRLTRHQRREAILGPIRLAGAEITPRLTDRLLNESLDTRDDLPVLQHVLMRTWNMWAKEGKGPLDLGHYEKSGTIQHALSIHADEALTGLSDESLKIAKRMFKALTETDASNRRIRRPAYLLEIAAVSAIEEAPEKVRDVIARFNADNRNFLVLSPGASDDNPLVDISHESLIRQWKTLAAWVDEEAESARVYKRLAESAELHAGGKAGFYREADLQVALDWQRQQQPNAEWAGRYHPKFELAMSFLEKSVKKQKTNRSFVASLLVCVYCCIYCWLMIAATRDVSLATNSVSLPIIETRMPADQIYLVFPLLLCSVYAYFLFYLHRLLRMLSRQPAQFADGRSWTNRLEEAGMYLLAWCTVPVTLVGFWVRYLLRRDWTVTVLHIFFITLVFGLMVLFHRSVRKGKSDGVRTLRQYLKPAGTAGVLSIALVFGSLSFGAFNGVPARELNISGSLRSFDASNGTAGRPSSTSRTLRAVVPWIFDRLGYDVFFDFRETYVSRLPDNYWCILSESDRLKSVRGAFLKKADLRYADLFRAFMVNANLRNADLRGARLRDANFKMADLRGANLNDADLRNGNFRGADFREAELAGIDFAGANLQEAQLGFADLRRSNFEDANLKNADLRCADLSHAGNLRAEDLASVRTLYRAKMSADVEQAVAEIKAALFDKPSDSWHDMTTRYNIGQKDICE
jgi:energy-coupling factor transporter ATP-binding protein EcfA2